MEEREKLRNLIKNSIDWNVIKAAFPDFNIN